MRKLVLPVALISALGIGTALAQTGSESSSSDTQMNSGTTGSGTSTGTSSDTSGTTGSSTGSSMDSGSTTGSTGTTGSTSSTSATGSSSITQQEAAAWVGKAVYDSAGNQVGEVAAVQPGTGGNVGEIHLDVGGFLGIGESRVKVQPSDISMSGDKLTLNMTKDQVNALPKVDKTQ